MMAVLLASLTLPDAAPAHGQPPTVPNPACSPPPALVVSDELGKHKAFGAGGTHFLEIQASFDTAYRHACHKGLMRETPLVAADSKRAGTLVLKNAPEANVASIYQEGGEGEPPGDTVLEYYFVTPDGVFHVPTAEDLEEAIYCSVHGATAQEEEESGRCLPD